jgi:hypothetical protein
LPKLYGVLERARCGGDRRIVIADILGAFAMAAWDQNPENSPLLKLGAVEANALGNYFRL